MTAQASSPANPAGTVLHGGPGAAHALLLTGEPGVGKTTVLLKVAEGLSGRRAKGFHTREIRREGRREGFRLTTFDGRDVLIAHVAHPGPKRVGRYGVDVRALDTISGSGLAPEEDVEVYLVDEIGKMECLSRVFSAAMRRLLASDRVVVATISKRGRGLIEEAKRGPGVELWEVTLANRNQLPEMVLQWIFERLETDSAADPAT